MLFRILAGIAAAALGAAAVLVFPGVSPDVEAGFPSSSGMALSSGKGDRLPIHLAAPSCAKAWPYFETDCLRDRTPTASQTRAIRLISVDRSAGK